MRGDHVERGFLYVLISCANINNIIKQARFMRVVRKECMHY